VIVVLLVTLVLVAVVLLSWEARRLAAQANRNLLWSAIAGLARTAWWLLKLTALLWYVAFRLVAGEVRSW